MDNNDTQFRCQSDQLIRILKHDEAADYFIIDIVIPDSGVTDSNAGKWSLRIMQLVALRLARSIQMSLALKFL